VHGQRPTPPTAPAGQASEAPRPAPTPRFQPLLDPQGLIREDAFIPTPTLSEADRRYADIDGMRMKTLVDDIVAISRRSRDDGNKYWGRIAGTKYEVMTGDVVEAKFKSLGLSDIHRKEFDLAPQWFPIDWSLTAVGLGKTQTFHTLLPALSSVPTNGEVD